MIFTPTDAVSLLIRRFPALKAVVNEDDLWTSPHIAYSLLATKVLENSTHQTLLHSAARFIDELANSGDSLLEELLVIDILEGVAQDVNVAAKLREGINAKAAAFLEGVEREFFGRSLQQ